MSDVQLIERFRTDPATAYRELLERYTSVILRMIRSFIQDADEMMEVYTSICERLSANDYRALQRFRSDGALTPWLSVVTANACRDRLRKRRTASVPNSVLSRLDDRERLVFKYHFQENLAHEDIAEIISRRHRVPYSALEVVRAISKINDLLSTRKRWRLLCALHANRPSLSIEELRSMGFQPSVDSKADAFDEVERHQELLDRLHDAISRLEAEDRLVLFLRFEQERTAAQVASVMGYDNHRYVYTRLRTIIHRLRRLMGEEGTG